MQGVNRIIGFTRYFTDRDSLFFERGYYTAFQATSYGIFKLVSSHWSTITRARNRWFFTWCDLFTKYALEFSV